MSEHVIQTLGLIKEQVRTLEAELAEKKRMANHLCEMAECPPAYPVIDSVENLAVLPSRGDEFYGMKLSPAIRQVLEGRQATNLGPATVNEIHSAIKAGGYRFEAASETNEKTSVRVCLTKNSAIFHKLPTGKFGLLKWYPGVKAKPNGNGAKGKNDDAAGREKMKDEFGPESAIEEVEKIEEIEEIEEVEEVEEVE